MTLLEFVDKNAVGLAFMGTICFMVACITIYNVVVEIRKK